MAQNGPSPQLTPVLPDEMHVRDYAPYLRESRRNAVFGLSSNSHSHYDVEMSRRETICDGIAITLNLSMVVGFFPVVCTAWTRNSRVVPARKWTPCLPPVPQPPPSRFPSFRSRNASSRRTRLRPSGRRRFAVDMLAQTPIPSSNCDHHLMSWQCSLASQLCRRAVKFRNGCASASFLVDDRGHGHALLPGRTHWSLHRRTQSS